MKKIYIRPNVIIQSMESCTIMDGSETTVTVGDMGGDQNQKKGTLESGGDAGGDVTPTSKYHTLWDDDWE